MIIQERNTKKFKDIINTIAKNMGWVELPNFSKKANKLTYNFNANGSIKERNYKSIGLQTDIIAMFYKQTTDKNAVLQFIRLNDYLSFIRDIKVSDVLGDKVNIIEKPRKVRAQKVAEFQPEVGKEYGVDCGRYKTYNIKCISRTKTTATFTTNSMYMNNNQMFRLNKEGWWVSSPATINSSYLESRAFTQDELNTNSSMALRASQESWYN